MYGYNRKEALKKLGRYRKYKWVTRGNITLAGGSSGSFKELIKEVMIDHIRLKIEDHHEIDKIQELNLQKF